MQTRRAMLQGRRLPLQTGRVTLQGWPLLFARSAVVVAYCMRNAAKLVAATADNLVRKNMIFFVYMYMGHFDVLQ